MTEVTTNGGRTVFTVPMKEVKLSKCLSVTKKTATYLLSNT